MHFLTAFTAAIMSIVLCCGRMVYSPCCGKSVRGNETRVAVCRMAEFEFRCLISTKWLIVKPSLDCADPPVSVKLAGSQDPTLLADLSRSDKTSPPYAAQANVMRSSRVFLRNSRSIIPLAHCLKHAIPVTWRFFLAMGVIQNETLTLVAMDPPTRFGIPQSKWAMHCPKVSPLVSFL